MIPAAGRTALVLGATGVLGRAITDRLRSRGFGCFLIDRDADAIGEMAALYDPPLPYAVADVTSSEQLAAAFHRALERSSWLDAVILAFGVEGPVGVLEDIDDAAFDDTMAINTKGVFLTLKLALPILKAQCAGSIVALGSISSTMAAPRLAAYAASKHALLGLVRTAAREAAEYGVRVNAVCPGPVESDMMKRIDEGLAANRPGLPEQTRGPATSVPLRRYATADDVANMVVFLCSDDSSYCTGLSFMVDGGYSGR